MELRRKDNLTDLVEALPKEPGDNQSASPKEPKNQEVVAADGSVVILGQKPSTKVPFNNRTSSLELSQRERLENVAAAATSAFKRALDRFFDQK
jgi:hypothetical protein